MATAFQGLLAGTRYRLADGSAVRNQPVGGQAQVQAFDGKKLEVTLDVSAAMGAVQKKFSLVLEDLGEGKIKAVAHELDAQGQVRSDQLNEELTVLTAQSGKLTLRTANGTEVSLELQADGGLVYTSPKANFVMARA